MFESESELEEYLRHLVLKKVIFGSGHFLLLDHKRVGDLVICRNGERPAAFFLEAKLFKGSSGRMGIGQGKGRGYQPEIIDKATEYFERNLRWVLVDGRRPAPNYLFVPSATIRQYVMGGRTGWRQNNIQPRIFEEIPGLD